MSGIVGELKVYKAYSTPRRKKRVAYSTIKPISPSDLPPRLAEVGKASLVVCEVLSRRLGVEDLQYRGFKNYSSLRV